MEVTAEIWNVKNGNITALRVGTVVYNVEVKTPLHNVKECYLSKWIRKNDIKIFTLDQFFRACPKQEARIASLKTVIARMIERDELQQLGKDRFRVKRVLKNGGVK